MQPAHLALAHVLEAQLLGEGRRGRLADGRHHEIHRQNRDLRSVLARPGNFDALDLAAAQNLQRRRAFQPLHAHVPQLLDLEGAAGRLAAGAAVDVVDLGRAEVDGAVGHVDGRVPGADDGQGLAGHVGQLDVGRAVFDGADGKEEFQARKDARQVLAGNAQTPGTPGARADHDGVVLLDHVPEAQDLAAEMVPFLVVQGAAAADLGVGVEDDAGLALQAARPEVDALLGDAVAGDAEEHEAAGLGQLVVDLDLVAKAGQVARGGQPRGAGADDPDAAAVGRGRFGTQEIEIDRVHGLSEGFTWHSDTCLFRPQCFVKNE